jgi:hypothetical protein
VDPLLIFLVVTILFYLGAYIYLKIKFNIKTDGIIYTHTSKIQKYGEAFLLTLFLIAGGIALFRGICDVRERP